MDPLLGLNLCVPFDCVCPPQKADEKRPPSLSTWGPDNKKKLKLEKGAHMIFLLHMIVLLHSLPAP